jgi:hypothetical protein
MSSTKDFITNLFVEIDAELDRATNERREEDLPGIRPLHIRVLGQLCLLMDERGLALNPAATRDMDALVVGDAPAVAIFRAVLRRRGLIYDELSSEIWLPDDALFLPSYSSKNLQVTYLDPISALTSKAIKAPEKNRFLVRRGIELFGESLERSIARYGGNISYFRGGRLSL